MEKPDIFTIARERLNAISTNTNLNGGGDSFFRSTSSVHDVHILVVGTNQGGKTSLINYLLGREEKKVKATIGLDYKYRQDDSVITHFWELGGGLKFAELLETVITTERIKNMRIIYVLDLNQPHELMDNMYKLYDAIKSRVQSCAADSRGQLSWNELLERVREYASSEPTSSARVAPGAGEISRVSEWNCGIPSMIIPARFDMFENSEHRGLMARTLRSLAIRTKSPLVYSNASDGRTMTRLRTAVQAFLNHPTLMESTANPSVAVWTTTTNPDVTSNSRPAATNSTVTQLPPLSTDPTYAVFIPHPSMDNFSKLGPPPSLTQISSLLSDQSLAQITATIADSLLQDPEYDAYRQIHAIVFPSTGALAAPGDAAPPASKSGKSGARPPAGKDKDEASAVSQLQTVLATKYQENIIDSLRDEKKRALERWKRRQVTDYNNDGVALSSN